MARDRHPPVSAIEPSSKAPSPVHSITQLRFLVHVPVPSTLLTSSRAPPSSALPLCSASTGYPLRLSAAGLGTRCFSTRLTKSSLNDPSPNWRNRPPKETILLDGCDFEHWLVIMEPPDPSLTRDEIIDSYIKTLAQVLGM
ncbi:hypothetical protein C4D60_Mb10t17470 [Musa balbisiana]|uniref:MORF/ORRM1/DAG-like MORF domain-containing protein n=1 Tax=Musa balbisiana TaxID=52838 RepID=A0A4S8IZ83_MUSBA|nr:hypothetical protein C4D60_Mb10t17470 [Musa balbisiana]